MLAFLAPAAIKLLLGRMWGNAKADVARIPPKAKLVLLAIALLVAAYFIHRHVAHKALKAADKAGYDRARGEDAAALQQLRQQLAVATANLANISRNERSKNDAANTSIRRATDILGLQGPGAASCRRGSAAAVSAGAGGPVEANRPADPAPTPMPAADGPDAFAAVPWRWLVGTGGQCDIERAENLSWRSAYVQWVAEWAKLRAGNGAKPSHQ